jgi:hypothetical protein
VVNHAPHGCQKWFCDELTQSAIKSCICILRVEVPDGSYTLVPANEDEGAGQDVHYVTVEQDSGQSPEVGVSACADEGKPWFIHLPMCSFKLLNLLIAILCAFTFRS